MDFDGFWLAFDGGDDEIAGNEHAKKVMVTRQNVERASGVDGADAVRVAFEIDLKWRVDFHRHRRLAV